MLKQKQLNRWFWRWHIIAGLVTLPVMLLLSLTGIAYLFKEHYNDAIYDDYRFVEVPLALVDNLVSSRASYRDQLIAAKGVTSKPIMQVTLPKELNQTTVFRVQGEKGDHTRNLIYVNPYTAEVTGQVNQRDTLMYKIRKLHGELLLSTPGTYVVELVASWFLMLIVTGLYVWWPAKRFSQSAVAGFFTIRTQKGQHLFYRDLHAVGGFWLSLVMAVILAGGMPWTDVFGEQLKWVQSQTDTGYPKRWNRSAGLSSVESGQPLSLDEMVDIAHAQTLQGQITIKLPMQSDGVFTVSNRSFLLRDQQVTHFDQYTGVVLDHYTWADVGVLMNLRQVAMRFHQGEYGLINWLFVLLVVIVFTLTTAAGLASYLIRKPKGRWGFPTVPIGFRAGYGVAGLMIVCGVMFPLFGASVVLILTVESLARLVKHGSALPPVNTK